MNMLNKFLTAITLPTLALVSSAAQSVEISNGPDRLNIGLGIKVESSPFVDVGNDSHPIIAGSIKQGGFYWQGNELGYRIIENKNFQFATIIRPFEGFDLEAADLSEGYKGFEDRDGKMEYGFSAAFNTGPVVTTITPLYNGEGMSLELDASRKWVSDSYVFKLKGYVRYDSADYQDYYFGISDAEVSNPLNTKINNAYKAESGISYGVKAIASYQVSESFYVQGLLEAGKLDSSITDSELVDSTNNFGAAIGIGYRF